MLKSGMSPNVDEKSSTFECTDINGVKLAKTKGRDKYLKHLKGRCTRGIYFCSLGSVILTYIGTTAAKGAAISTAGAGSKNCIYAISIFHMLNHKSMSSALTALGTVGCAADYASGATSASAIFLPCGKTKGRDKYLKHLKHRCIGGICSCTLGSALLAYIGTVAAKVAVIGSFGDTVKNCISSISILHMLTYDSMNLAMQSVNAAGSVTCVSDLAGATGTAYAIFVPCGITALVLLILAVVLIIIYIWLYRRRKRSWKHECKKHLCK
ncbi:hypothetical protein PFNF54_05935 [Plasmodium falciparum NF54]|uniref:Stevor n=1 Tax=Plasmodium falciparum (isolate NF54) TaxID=5843 RepID=W7JVZ3_PLAFO|nr:hypothetical protein PFNF54_05935 [Plasmodium falciparum NF54]